MTDRGRRVVSPTNLPMYDDQMMALRELSREQDRPVARLVREALDEYLAKRGRAVGAGEAR